MSNNNKPLDILLYGVLVYDLLEALQRKLTTPAVITRLKENVAPDVLAAHTSRADVVIALKYSGMPPAPLSAPRWVSIRQPIAPQSRR